MNKTIRPKSAAECGEHKGWHLDWWRRVLAVVGCVTLSALSLGYMEPSRATPLTNIDGVGIQTGFILWIPGELPGVYSMTHDAAAGRSRYLQQGAWDYSP